MLECYFCGHEATVQLFTPMKRTDEYYVQCTDPSCQARGPWRNSEQDAIDAWLLKSAQAVPA